MFVSVNALIYIENSWKINFSLSYEYTEEVKCTVLHIITGIWFILMEILFNVDILMWRRRDCIILVLILMIKCISMQNSIYVFLNLHKISNPDDQIRVL